MGNVGKSDVKASNIISPLTGSFMTIFPVKNHGDYLF